MRDLASFPTRRSSDLGGKPCAGPGEGVVRSRARQRSAVQWLPRQPGNLLRAHETRPEGHGNAPPERWSPDARRSEEHTSELQSRFELVCRLLLEKKKW